MSVSTLKKLGFVCGLLVVLWIAYLYRQVPHETAPFAKAADSASHVLRQQGSKKVHLSKEAGSWKVQLDSRVWSPADDDQIKRLLSALKEAQVEDVISDRADRASEFEVDETRGIRMTVEDAKGTMLAEGIFGKLAPDAMHIYMRYPGQPIVRLARGVFPEELGKPDPNAWRSRNLVEIPENKIQAILIQGQGFKTELVQVSTNAWTMNGKSVGTRLIDSLVGALAHLQAVDFIDSANYPGLAYDSLTYARLSVKAKDAAAELRVGPLDGQTKRYPVSTGQDAGLAWVSETTINSLLQKPSAFREKH